MFSKGTFRRSAGVAALCALVAGCAMPREDVALLDGPPVTDIVTSFDEALYCLDGRIDSRLTFGVGGIPDQTGRDQNSTEGTGRFVTQGAGDIVQSALFNAGVTLINRRDMGSAAMEAQWGIRDLSQQRPANLVITGSINSLDFIPGGGAIASVGGIGPRYRQNRILVGMDLAMTNNATGQIVANIALRKQLVADELGFMVARTVDNNIVDLDFGGSRREALHFALREMLQLATFELLAQLMPARQYEECRNIIDETMAVIEGERTSGGQMRRLHDRRAAEAAAAAALRPPEPPAPETPVEAESGATPIEVPATSASASTPVTVPEPAPADAAARAVEVAALVPAQTSAEAPQAPAVSDGPDGSDGPRMQPTAVMSGLSTSGLGPEARRAIDARNRALAETPQGAPAASPRPASRPASQPAPATDATLIASDRTGARTLPTGDAAAAEETDT